MKKTISLFAFLCLFIFNVSSQNNDLVIFSDSPNPFYLILNGISQNNKAVTNVKVVDLQTTNNSVKILFEDNSINPILKTIYFDTINTQYSYRIVSTKKKGYKLRGFDRTPKAYVPTNNSVPTIVYKTVNVPAQKETVVVETVTTTTNLSNQAVNANVGVNDNLETGGNVSMNLGVNDNSAVGGNVSMNVGVNDNSEFGENVNFNMNVNVSGGVSGTTEVGAENVNINMGLGVNDGMGFDDNGNVSINMNLNEGNMDASSSMNGNMNVNMNINDALMNNAMNQANSNMGVNMNVNETVTTTTTTTTINEVPVAVAPVVAAPVSSGGCINPVQDMASIMAAIDDESFDDGKIIVAKQATSKKCLTVDQIKQIMNEFSFSKNKLNFAKYAYKRCYNPDDYYQVNGAFDFSSEKEEMNEFINDQN